MYFHVCKNSVKMFELQSFTGVFTEWEIAAPCEVSSLLTATKKSEHPFPNLFIFFSAACYSAVACVF